MRLTDSAKSPFSSDFPPQPHLLLIGASVRSLAGSARRAGFYVTAIDLFNDADLLTHVDVAYQVAIDGYPENLLPLVQHIVLGSAAPTKQSSCGILWPTPTQSPPSLDQLPPVQAVVWTGGLENQRKLLRQINEICPVWSTLGTELDEVRDPFQVTSALAQHGFLTARLKPSLETTAPACDPAHLRSTTAWLRKPYRSAGGRNIGFASNEATQVGRSSRLDEERFYYQEYIAGATYSGLFVANERGCHLYAVTRQWIGHDNLAHPTFLGYPFGHLASVVVHLPSHEYQQWADLGNVIAARFSMRGIFGIDAIAVVNGNHTREFIVVEVNPRYTASAEIIERTLGLSLMHNHAIVFCSDIAQQQRSTSICLSRDDNAQTLVWGKRILFAPVTFRCTRRLTEEFAELCAQAGPRIELADIPRCPIDIQRGEPICTLMVAGQTTTDVEQLLGLTQPSQLLTAFERLVCAAEIVRSTDLTDGQQQPTL